MGGGPRRTRSDRRRSFLVFLVLATFIAQLGIAPAVLADPSSPLTVTKTATPNPVASGAQLTYTIVVQNDGGAKVDNVVLTDQVNGVGVIQSPPALPQLTITSTKGSCTQGGPNGNLVTCNAGTMVGREIWTVTIRGQVTAPNNTTLNNTASVTGTKSAQTFTTTGSTSVLVSGGTGGGDLPDLTINKTGPTSVAPITAFAYTLTINNLGTANTSNVRVVDTLPAGVTFVSTSTTSLFTCQHVAGTVTCAGGAVNQGQNATITINVESPGATGPITNTAVVDPDNTIAESNELNNTSSFGTSVGGPPPDELLSILKTDGNPDINVSWDTGAGPDPVNPGEELVYKIQVKNNASSRADDVRITDTTQGLEASSLNVSMVVVDGAIGVGGGCQAVAPHAICEVKSLQSGGTITMTVRGMVIAPAGATIFNTATVNGNIKNVGVTNTASEATTIRPSIDLTITKDDGPDPACARTWPTTNPNQHLANPPFGLAPAGGSIPPAPDDLLAPAVCLGGLTYSFVIGNSGNGDATNVTVRDALPAGLIFDSYESTAGFVCSVDGANVVTCTGGAIAAADTETLTFRLVAPPTVGSITNTVSVDPNNAIFEPDETNNTDVETTTISTGVDLVIWKGDDKFVADPPDTDGDPSDEDPPGGAPPLTEGFDPIATNATQTYTIIVDNVGPQDVTGIKVRDVLPAGTKFLSFSATNGFTCTHDGSTYGGNVTCIGGHLFGTEAEFYDPPGPTGPTFGIDDRATIVVKVFATSFVQPIMHNEVRVDPDNEIAEINELNNFAFQNTTVGVGDSDQGAFNQLTIDKTQFSPSGPLPADFEVAQNGILIYDLKVSNLGTDPVSAVVVKDFLPAGSRFIEAIDTDVGPSLSDAFFCFHDGLPAGGTVTCVGGDFSGSINKIPDGAGFVPTERHIRIKIFAPPAPGTYVNIAVVDPDNLVPEGNEFDNDDAVFTKVTVGGNNMFNDLTITKCDQQQPQDDDPGCAFDRDPVAPSGEMKYILTVSNLGTDPAFDVKVTDNLPVGTIFVSAEDSAPGPGAFDCV
ncbi:MAG TPA: CARDB domain-containing protein, partial [Candidatus Limnocylindrales bacterium]|nr:CARDB domain-containing protein [Candidatus Limnocylindrales bacterium]